MYIIKTQGWYKPDSFWNVVVFKDHCSLDTKEGIIMKNRKDFDHNRWKYMHSI